MENKMELEQIKIMLLPTSTDYSDTLQCLSTPAQTFDELEQFWLKLQDRGLRKNVVLCSFNSFSFE
jgi:hypothetical protein